MLGGVAPERLDLNGLALDWIAPLVELQFDELVGLVKSALRLTGPGVVRLAIGQRVLGEVEKVSPDFLLAHLGD
jgi:hypothetical protein